MYYTNDLYLSAAMELSLNVPASTKKLKCGRLQRHVMLIASLSMRLLVSGTMQGDLCRPSISMVPVVGVEPTRSCPHRILSPARLPIPPHRQRLILKDKILLLQSFRRVIWFGKASGNDDTRLDYLTTG